MTDNEIIKSIDNDIIKALERWKKNFDGKAVDFMTLNFALNLINRQKEKLTETQAKLEDLLCEVTGGKLSKHIYTAEVMKTQAHEYLLKCCDDERVEAVTEFAEELIYKIVNTPTKFESTYYMYRDGIAFRQNEIIDIIKEMVGDGT